MLVVCQLTNRTERKNIFHLTGNVRNLKAFPFPKQCENKQQQKFHESHRKKDKVTCNCFICFMSARRSNHSLFWYQKQLSTLQGRPKSDTAYREIKGTYAPLEIRATAISFALHCHSTCSFFFCFSITGVLVGGKFCSTVSSPAPKQSFTFWKCPKRYDLLRINILMLLLDRGDPYSAIIWFWRGICTDFCRLWHMPMTRGKPSAIRKPHSCADTETPGQNEWQTEVKEIRICYFPMQP